MYVRGKSLLRKGCEAIARLRTAVGFGSREGAASSDSSAFAFARLAAEAVEVFVLAAGRFFGGAGFLLAAVFVVFALFRATGFFCEGFLGMAS